MRKSALVKMGLTGILGVVVVAAFSGLAAWAADEKPAVQDEAAAKKGDEKKVEAKDAPAAVKPAEPTKTDEEKKAEEAAKKKAADEAKKKAAAEKEKLAEQKKKEQEKKRRENWEKYILENYLENYRKQYPAIAKASDELKGLYTEMEPYDQIQDPKEKRKVEPKIRAVQGKIKRTKGTLDKELGKVVKPLKLEYDNLKQKDKDLQKRIANTNDENQKRRLAEEQAKLFGPLEGLDIKLFLFDYFARAGQEKQDEAADEKQGKAGGK
ncbi:MAG: hypothetical protein A3K19_08800 [Lentisphaerae bacterium RIFOXYB12_FULL_65_16]|nr:MAG: hypothetical protein A3K18_02725 [Lentisphaerae bacterium RIFOXYA12_64_32]OGV86030.1 MAG: hypothetical protein A3K19_08800 [Lentisphaerae bacterium RIFOXYB12_FULL_65_16]